MPDGFGLVVRFVILDVKTNAILAQNRAARRFCFAFC
jgi:hypothetical protein